MSMVKHDARRDARRGEWTGIAGPEGAGKPPVDQRAVPGAVLDVHIDADIDVHIDADIDVYIELPE